MLKVFRRLILRPLGRDRSRTALSILSIALGIAVVIAIELAGDAAAGSFESSLATLVGKIDYEITANGGVDETYLAALTALPMNARFSPVIEQPISIPGGGSTILYGIDVLTAGQSGEGDPGMSAVVSSDLASRLHWSKGQTITLKGPNRSAQFTLRGVIANQNTGWIGLDIAAAQQLLDMYGRVDRIEVFLDPGQSPEQAERKIKATVPPSWNIETPGARREENQRMLRAFRWNLRILSYISLVVGAFLIYNTIAVSVVRRRTEIGVLRALGMTANSVQSLFLAEAVFLGFTGSLLGLALGRLLAGLIIGMISDTVNALFTTSAPGAITLTPLSIVAAMITGTAVSFLSALIPAREAAGVAPAEAMSQAAREYHVRLNARRDLCIAAVLSVIGITLCQFGPVGGRPVFGYIAAFFFVGSAAELAPAFSAALVTLLRGTLKRIAGAPGLIAGRSLVASLARTSVVVSALATAISMMVSVGIMVGSFRETVQIWLDSQLRADVYLRAVGPATAGIYPPIDPKVAAIVQSTPGAGQVDILHAFTFHYEGTAATLGGAKTDIIRRRRAQHFLSGDADAILKSLLNHDRAVVSEPFANKHHVHPGDVLHIPLGTRMVNFTVAGIYYDYSSDRGFVLVDRSTLLKYLPAQPITNIAVYAKPGTPEESLRRDLESRLARFPLLIAPNSVLRRAAIEVFDRTFAVTYALEAVAILVAMLGAANSLLALVLDRRREIGLIRYLGAAEGQIRRMILTEAGLIGLLAGVLGLALGIALSLVLILVVNKQSFGWTIQFHPPIVLLAGALLLVWFGTIFAGVIPARMAQRLEPAEAVHTE